MKIFLFFFLIFLFINSIVTIPTCLIIETNDTTIINDETQARSFSSFSTTNRTLSSCSLTSLKDIEDKMIIPFEFRRLHIEQADHRTKYLNSDRHESFADGSTAVYEHRSHPDGVRYCRNCHDGNSMCFFELF